MFEGTPAQAAWQAGSTISADVDEHAAHLCGWHQEYHQLDGGRFEGRLNQARSHGVQLFREQTSRRLRQRCEVWQGALWCGITATDDGSRLDGRQVGADAIMLSGRDGSFELVSPPGHDIVGFVIDREALAAQAPELQAPADAGWWPVDPARRRAALVHARAILALAATGTAGDLRDAMIGVFVDLVCARGPAPSERGNASARRRLVAHAHALIAATPDRAPSVPELCSALHVSRRTLQYVFEHEAGVSPLAYLRSVRLHGVRRLLHEAAGTITVQSAAERWGFLNLSAFASDYRRQFGERASETLARAAPRAAVAATSR